MKKIKFLLLSAILPLSLLLLAGCSITDNSAANDSTMEETSVTSGTYTKITPEEAKEMMDQDSGVIILDVRTLDEYNSGHIADAVLLPDTQIADYAEEVLPDKDAVILVYCRSGRRSAASSQTLADMGYTNIYDFGGIIDWPYDTTTE